MLQCGSSHMGAVTVTVVFLLRLIASYGEFYVNVILNKEVHLVHLCYVKRTTVGQLIINIVSFCISSSKTI